MTYDQTINRRGSLAADVNRLEIELSRLKRAAIALYLAGHWKCTLLDMDRQDMLWKDLRDAAGLAPGTATCAGVALDSHAVAAPK